MHDLWTTSCILNHGMRSLDRVIHESLKRESLRAKGFVLIRWVMAIFKVSDVFEKHTEPTTTADLNAGGCPSGGFDIKDILPSVRKELV